METPVRSSARATAAPEAEGAVVTKALLRAAGRLAVSNKALAAIVGVSEATVSRMGAGTYALRPGEKAFELAVLFLRLFRSLDAVVDGDEQVARAWLRNDNLAFEDKPLSLIQSIAGLVHVVAYLDARRALV
jgi:hypothetical protein